MLVARRQTSAFRSWAPGRRGEAQLRQNLGATGWKLTPTQMAQLEASSAKPRIYP